MKKSFLILSLCCVSMSFHSVAEDLSRLDDKAKADQKVENAHNQRRVISIEQQMAQLQSMRNKLAEQLTQIQESNEALTATFSNNEALLAEKEKELQLATGSLGELFGVVRQAAKETQLKYETSFLGAQGQDYDVVLTQVISTDTLPSLNLLQRLWQAMEYKVKTANELSLVSIPVVSGDGKTENVEALRMGDIALLTDRGYVKWQFAQQQAFHYLALPDSLPRLAQVKQTLPQQIALDPTRGAMLEQYAHQPSLMQRIDQAGIVGKIILLILVIGLIISVVRGIHLMLTQQKISKQLKQADNPSKDNPLGRILTVYNKEKTQSIESLELRLLETILDEQQGLERGLSMLKLFAALAPMLGLLGTVTGMIETFQVITQYGNGDPKVMAGGISMALITTVLGLVAAMPLLLTHNLLSNRAEIIRNTLEKQGVSLVARRAELDDVELEHSKNEKREDDA